MAGAADQALKAVELSQSIKGMQDEYKVDTQKVRTVVFELDALKNKGILIDVDTTGFGMFTARATYSELGVPREDMRAQRIKPGHKPLLPKRYMSKLDSLNTRITDSARRHSLRIPAFGKWNFLTAAAYWSWKEDWERLMLELAGLKEQIIINREQILEEVRKDWTVIGIEAWDSLRGRAVSRAHEEGHKLERTRTDELKAQREKFILEVADAAVARFPENSRIVEELGADYTPGFLQNANELRQAQLELEQQEVAIREKNLTLTAEEEKIRAMREAEVQHARERLSKMRSPIDEALDQVEQQIYKQVQQLLASFKKYGYLPGRTPEKARKLKELWETMSVRSKPELEEKIAQLMKALPRSGEAKKKSDGPTYDANAVGAALIELSNITVHAFKEEELVDIEAFDPYSGTADIEADIPEEMLTESESYQDIPIEVYDGEVPVEEELQNGVVELELYDPEGA